jgi:hypothetical protein
LHPRPQRGSELYASSVASARILQPHELREDPSMDQTKEAQLSHRGCKTLVATLSIVLVLVGVAGCTSSAVKRSANLPLVHKTTTTTTAAKVPGTDTCAPNQLLAFVEGTTTTGTTLEATIALDNTGTASCILSGFPTYSIVDTYGAPLKQRRRQWRIVRFHELCRELDSPGEGWRSAGEHRGRRSGVKRLSSWHRGWYRSPSFKVSPRRVNCRRNVRRDDFDLSHVRPGWPTRRFCRAT